MIIQFEELKIYVKKTGACQVCQKLASRQTKLWQTVSQFNKNTDGTIKTREQIMQELKAEQIEWLEKPIVHVRCESK